MTDLFETHYRAHYVAPCETVTDLAAYLLHEDNDDPAHRMLQALVRRAAEMPDVSVEVNPLYLREIVRLPEAAALMRDANPRHREVIALGVLTAMLQIARGAA